MAFGGLSNPRFCVLLSPALTSVHYSTIVSNSTPLLGVRDGWVVITAALSLDASIIAYHAADNCLTLNGGVIASGGYNIEDQNDCGLADPSDQTGTDPPNSAAG